MVSPFKIEFLLKTIGKYLLSYRKRLMVKQNISIHILFCTVDHYEPGTGYVDRQTEVDKVSTLLDKYPKLVRHHRDSSGNLPKRTWFFPPHYHRYHALKKLVSLCENGYGEIELHLHHGKSRPDTSDNLERTIKKCVEEYSLFGIFGMQNDLKRYGFIHGDWALDNSRKGKYCGVNDEIDILIRTGCYADFTFPSMNEANPAQINSIYYTKDNPLKPKSYNTGITVKKLGGHQEGLIIIQGPLCPFFKNKNILGLRVMGDSIDSIPDMLNNHIDSWIHTGIHVEGIPNVVFIKTHIHGASYNYLTSETQRMELIFSYLENNYNDGSRYILHYVTAREMYNVIKALENGEEAKMIEQLRNYEIVAPKYDSSPNISGASEELSALVYKTYC